MCSREWIVHAYQNESESARCDPDTNEIKNGRKGREKTKTGQGEEIYISLRLLTNIDKSSYTYIFLHERKNKCTYEMKICFTPIFLSHSFPSSIPYKNAASV